MHVHICTCKLEHMWRSHTAVCVLAMCTIVTLPGVAVLPRGYQYYNAHNEQLNYWQTNIPYVYMLASCYNTHCSFAASCRWSMYRVQCWTCIMCLKCWSEVGQVSVQLTSFPTVEEGSPEFLTWQKLLWGVSSFQLPQQTPSSIPCTASVPHVASDKSVVESPEGNTGEGSGLSVCACVCACVCVCVCACAWVHLSEGFCWVNDLLQNSPPHILREDHCVVHQVLVISLWSAPLSFIPGLVEVWLSH